jgi:hypothetical protein
MKVKLEKMTNRRGRYGRKTVYEQSPSISPQEVDCAFGSLDMFLNNDRQTMKKVRNFLNQSK